MSWESLYLLLTTRYSSTMIKWVYLPAASLLRSHSGGRGLPLAWSNQAKRTEFRLKLRAFVVSHPSIRVNRKLENQRRKVDQESHKLDWTPGWRERGERKGNRKLSKDKRFIWIKELGRKKSKAHIKYTDRARLLRAFKGIIFQFFSCLNFFRSYFEKYVWNIMYDCNIANWKLTNYGSFQSSWNAEDMTHLLPSYKELQCCGGKYGRGLWEL